MSTKENHSKSRLSRKRIHLAWILFSIYLVVLFYFLFFAKIAGRTQLYRTYDYNLIPFKEIHRFIEYRKTLGLTVVIVNLLGNIMAFVPFGGLLPLLVKRFKYFPSIFFLSFFFSLTVEIIQLITKVGCFDVDDLILNTLGGALGYLCFFFVYSIKRRKKHGEKI